MWYAIFGAGIHTVHIELDPTYVWEYLCRRFPEIQIPHQTGFHLTISKTCPVEGWFARASILRWCLRRAPDYLKEAEWAARRPMVWSINSMSKVDSVSRIPVIRYNVTVILFSADSINTLISWNASWVWYYCPFVGPSFMTSSECTWVGALPEEHAYYASKDSPNTLKG